jgi:glucosylceramidase
MFRKSFLLSLLSIGIAGCGSGGGSTSINNPPPPPPAATPQFSPSAGTYTAAQTVSITDASAGTAIYYTTDGSTPALSSTRYTTAIAVAADTTIQAIATGSGYTQSAAASGKYLIAGPTVSVVLSTDDRATLMAAQPAVSFTTTNAGSNKVIVDETQIYQPIEGFGAAFTDSAAYLLNEVAPSSALPGAMSDLFTRNGSGIGLSFMRIPMGASDIARTQYSFDDQPPGQTDPTLADFSIAHDQADILPIVQQAKSLNPEMKLMANPWSPPGWMKSTDSLIGGTLLPTMDSPFANYFVKYIQAYQAAGVPIDYISLQNEPLYQPTNYPGMGMDAPTQLIVLRDHILPALAAHSIASKVLVYDHNWDQSVYPQTVFSDPTILASSQVAGTAWHGYGGVPGGQQVIQNLFPTKAQYETEHSGGTNQTDQFNTDFEEITLVLRNSARSFVKWSLALDENLGPHDGGCGNCTPIVTVNSTTGAITKDVEYYTLGHYSKYVLPGASRIYSSNANGVDTVAFINPDSSKALVAFNDSSAGQTFQVQWGVNSLTYTLAAKSAATFGWTGTQSGASPATAATTQIQASSFQSESGLQTEFTSDTNAGYDLGYVTPGADAIYKSIDFGTSVSSVNVRSASAGSGGTLEFHLDSLTGPLIATANLPVTGGWQTWQTNSTTVSGASGVHDLFLIFQGTGANGIANLNWFQFQ